MLLVVGIYIDCIRYSVDCPDGCAVCPLKLPSRLFISV